MTETNSDVEVAANAEAAARSCAERIVCAARAAIAARGKFSLALAGGSTPKATYKILAAEHRGDVDWSHVHFFVGDERMVPHDDSRSNWGNAKTAWLGELRLPDDVLHPMPLEEVDDRAARKYEALLRAQAPDGLDFVMLGLGDDGHTASLFPGRIDALESERWVVAARAPLTSPVERRITMTFAAFEASRQVVFTVCGASKARMVADVLAGRGNHPAGRVLARESLSWILDTESARQWLAEKASPRALS